MFCLLFDLGFDCLYGMGCLEGQFLAADGNGCNTLPSIPFVTPGSYVHVTFQFCSKRYFYLSPVNLRLYFHSIEMRLLSAAEGQSNQNQGCDR